MLKNYFKTTWRNLVKDRRFTLLNLLGLSTGLACTLLIYLWVTDELQMDKFHQNDPRLYQVMENRVQGPNIWTAQSAPAPEADALAKEMPEVQYTVATVDAYNTTLTSFPEKDIKSNGLYAGPDFFHVFSYNLIRGNPGQVLTGKNAIVLSDLLARRLFGTTENLIGKNRAVSSTSSPIPSPGSLPRRASIPPNNSILSSRSSTTKTRRTIVPVGTTPSAPPILS